MLRASTDSRRQININVNLMHTSQERPSLENRKTKPKHDSGWDKGQDRAVMNQMSQVVKSLLVGTTLSHEARDDLQLTSSLMKDATPI